jgi:carbamoylphosphate synthase large subunit
MKESNIETILINPNIATIQTSHQMASEVYCASLRSSPFLPPRY